jgi:hypothetical protein
MHFGGGPAKMQLLGHGNEVGKLASFHIEHSSSLGKADARNRIVIYV